MAPPQAIPILGQMKDTSVQAPHLWSFGGVPYLAKRPRPDFNNGSGDNSNCGCILGPQHLFEFDLNNDPSPRQFQSWVRCKYFCSPELVVSENFNHTTDECNICPQA